MKQVLSSVLMHVVRYRDYHNNYCLLAWERQEIKWSGIYSRLQYKKVRWKICCRCVPFIYVSYCVINFKKDQHGLRERDIKDKDKQNYEAVLRMSSKSDRYWNNTVMVKTTLKSTHKHTTVYLAWVWHNKTPSPQDDLEQRRIILG